MTENYRLDLSDGGISSIFLKLRDFFRHDDLSYQEHSLTTLHDILGDMNVIDLDEPVDSPRRNRPAYLAGIEFDTGHVSASGFMRVLQNLFEDPDLPVEPQNLSSLRGVLSKGLHGGNQQAPKVGLTQRDWSNSARGSGETRPPKDWSKGADSRPSLPPRNWNK